MPARPTAGHRKTINTELCAGPKTIIGNGCDGSVNCGCKESDSRLVPCRCNPFPGNRHTDVVETFPCPFQATANLRNDFASFRSAGINALILHYEAMCCVSFSLAGMAVAHQRHSRTATLANIASIASLKRVSWSTQAIDKRSYPLVSKFQAANSAFIFFSALASIWRIRSAETPYSSARSCSVILLSASSQRRLTMSRERASSLARPARNRSS